MGAMITRRDIEFEVAETGDVWELVEDADGGVSVRMVTKDKDKDGEGMSEKAESGELTDRQVLATSLDALIATGKMTMSEAAEHLADFEAQETAAQAEKHGLADGAVEKAAGTDKRKPTLEQYIEATLRRVKKGWR